MEIHATEVPFVSVVIPTYNRSHSIQESINSVLNQTYTAWEIIIADDCSQDNTEEVVRQIQDSRIRYYRLPENRGAGGARNFGVKKASGHLIAFLDSDDAWVEDKLEKQMEYWQQYPECGLIYSAYEIKVPSGACYTIPNETEWDNLAGDIFPRLLCQNTIGAPTVLLRKSVFQEVGGFDESMRSLEDWDFALKVAKKYPVGFVPEVLLKVAGSEGGVSSNLGAYYQNRCYMLRKYRADYLATGMFEQAVQDILEKAKRDNLMSQVEKMMMLYLAK